VAIFSSAKTLISVHGAGLANLVFCHSSTNVIEMFNELYRPKMYESLSRRLKLNYLEHITRNEGSSAETQTADITVDVPKLISQLEGIDAK